MLITDEYKAQLQKLHKHSFGGGGARWKDEVLRLCELNGTQDVLDYGSGKGRLAKALPFPIKQYDPAIGPDERAPSDIVVCTDVLEHIEPECLDDVLDDLFGLCREVAFLVISTRPAHKSLPDGRNAHLIVEPFQWWFAKLRPRCRVFWSTTDDDEMIVRMFVSHPMREDRPCSQSH